MDRNRMNVLLASVLTTLGGLEEEGIVGAPEGPLYAGLMGHGASYGDWEDVRAILLQAKLVTSTGHCMRLTLAGWEMVSKIEAATEAPYRARA